LGNSTFTISDAFIVYNLDESSTTANGAPGFSLTAIIIIAISLLSGKRKRERG
jgi:hypothetical protein